MSHRFLQQVKSEQTMIKQEQIVPSMAREHVNDVNSQSNPRSLGTLSPPISSLRSSSLVNDLNRSAEPLNLVMPNKAQLLDNLNENLRPRGLGTLSPPISTMWSLSLGRQVNDLNHFSHRVSF